MKKRVPYHSKEVFMSNNRPWSSIVLISSLLLWPVTSRAPTIPPYFEEKNETGNTLHLYLSVLGINDAICPTQWGKEWTGQQLLDFRARIPVWQTQAKWKGWKREEISVWEIRTNFRHTVAPKDFLKNQPSSEVGRSKDKNKKKKVKKYT